MQPCATGRGICELSTVKSGDCLDTDIVRQILRSLAVSGKSPGNPIQLRQECLQITFELGPRTAWAQGKTGKYKWGRVQRSARPRQASTR